MLESIENDDDDDELSLRDSCQSLHGIKKDANKQREGGNHTVMMMMILKG